jgi:O-antigen/teichoic acid export membrane protein
LSVVREPGRAVLNMAAKGASFAVEKAAQLVLALVAARELGAAVFGQFSYAASLGVLLAFATDLGLTTWTTRALARDPAQAADVLGTGLRLRLFAAVPVVVALAGVAVRTSAPDLRWAVLALGAAALARALLDHARAVFRAHERLADEGRVNAATAVAGTLGGLAALAAGGGGGGGLRALALGVMAGTFAGAAYGFALLGRRHGPWAGPADQALARRMLKEAAPFWFAGLFTLVYARGDVVLLQLLSSDAEVGAYRAGGQLVEVVKQLPVLFMTALFPQLARAAPGPRSALVPLENVLLGLLLAGGVLAGGVLAAAAGPIVGALFGAEFARGVPALRLLAAAVPLQFINCGLLHVFVARDRGSLNVSFAGAAAVINVAANLLLDARAGAAGAAAATLITEAALCACCVAALRALRREGVGPSP